MSSNSGSKKKIHIVILPLLITIISLDEICGSQTAPHKILCCLIPRQTSPLGWQSDRWKRMMIMIFTCSKQYCILCEPFLTSPILGSYCDGQARINPYIHTHTHTHTHIHAYITVLMLQQFKAPPKHQKKKSSRTRMLQDLIKNYSNYSWMRRTNPRSLLPLPSPGALELFVAASEIQKLPWERTSESGFLSFFLSEHEIADDSSWVVLWHIRASVCRRAEILTATSKDRERPLFFPSLSLSLSPKKRHSFHPQSLLSCADQNPKALLPLSWHTPGTHTLGTAGYRCGCVLLWSESRCSCGLCACGGSRRSPCCVPCNTAASQIALSEIKFITHPSCW
jgi:hypothetical protein